MRLRKLIPLLFYVAPLALLTFVSWRLLDTYASSWERDLRPMVEGELSKYLKREVKVGRVVLRNGSVFLERITVANGLTLAASGPMISAGRVDLDLDFRRLLLHEDPKQPRVFKIVITNPVASVRRDKLGIWNFSDLIHPSKAPATEPSLGAIEVRNGAVHYLDDGLPLVDDRPAKTMSAEAEGVNGTLTFGDGGAWWWDVSCTGLPGGAGTTMVSGSFDPTGQRLLITGDVADLHISRALRFLPRTIESLDGLATGRFAVSIDLKKGPRDRPFVVAGAHVRNGSARFQAFGKTVTPVNGEFSWNGDTLSANTDFGLPGASGHINGTLKGLQQPVIQATITGGFNDPQRLLEGIQPERLVRAPSGAAVSFVPADLLKYLHIQGTLRASVTGPLKDLTINATAPIMLSGEVENWKLTQPLTGTISLQNSLSQPTAEWDLSSRNVSHRFPGPVSLNITNLRTTGTWSKQLTTAQLTANLFGGRCSLRANATNDQYTAEMSAQSIDMSSPLIPMLFKSATSSPRPFASQSTETPTSSLSGLANLTATYTGTANWREGTGSIRARIFGPQWHRWAAKEVSVQADLGQGIVNVPWLVVNGERGSISARGNYDLSAGAIDFTGDADNLNLRSLLPPLNDGPTYDGDLWLRGIHIQGSIHNPQMSGEIYAQSLTSSLAPARMTSSGPVIDTLSARFHGDSDDMVIDQATASRLPTKLSLKGLVHQPFSPRAYVDLVGTVEHVDLADALSSAGLQAPVSGDMSSKISVSGHLLTPTIDAIDVDVKHARYSEFALSKLTGALSWTRTEHGHEIRVDSLVAQIPWSDGPLSPTATVTMSGTLDSTGGVGPFTMRLRARSIGFSQIHQYLPTAVGVGGSVSGQMSLSGTLQDSSVHDLLGEIRVTTRGLTLNRVSIGELHGQAVGTQAVFNIRGNQISSLGFAIGTGGSEIRVAGIGNEPGFSWDQQTGDVLVNGSIDSFPADHPLRIIAGSPAILEKPDSALAKVATSLSQPLGGSWSGGFSFSKSGGFNRASLRLQGDHIAIEGNTLDSFVTRVALVGTEWRLEDLAVRDGAAELHATGRLIPDTAVSANLEVNNLPVSFINRYLPGRPILRDLDGMLESLDVTVSGVPENPSAKLSLLGKDIRWIETDSAASKQAQATSLSLRTPGAVAPRLERRILGPHNEADLPVTGRELWFSGIQTSAVTINDPAAPNILKVESFDVTLREPDPHSSTPGRPRTPLAQPREFKVYLSGSSPFSWDRLIGGMDPEITASVRIPKQPLQTLASLVPRVDGPTRIDERIDGTISANVDWAGTVREPMVTGTAEIADGAIRLADRATRISGLNALMRFDGSFLEFERFSGVSEIIDARTGKLVKQGKPITVTGALALNDASSGETRLRLWPPQILGGNRELHIKSEGLALAETNFPGMKDAKLVIDEAKIDITATGRLNQPRISGRVDIVKGEFRMPTAIVETRAGRPFVLQPVFDVAIGVPGLMRFVAPPLSAAVGTDFGRDVRLTGDLAGGDPARLKLNGNLLVRDGVMAFPTARLTLQKGGSVQLRYPFFATGGTLEEPGLGVILDIIATTKVSAPATSDPSRLNRYTIAVEARGPINAGQPVSFTDDSIGSAVGPNGATGALRLTFRTDPPNPGLTQADIRRSVLGALGGESAIQDVFGSSGKGAWQKQIAAVLSDNLLPEWLGQTGIDRVLGLDEFSLDSNRLSGFTLRVGKQIIGPLYASYTRRLSGNGTLDVGGANLWQLRLSYRIRPNLQFSYTVDDLRQNALLLEGVFRY